MKNINFEVDENNKDIRVDKFLSQNLSEISRAYVHKLIENQSVTVNGKSVAKNYRLSIGECIKVIIPDPEILEVAAENILLDIVYEDDDLLIVNKSKDMVVHPAPGHYTGTLVNALMHHCKDSLSGINGVLRQGIVHRIDKDTSGLLVVAKSDRAHEFLASQIKDHNFTREYEAVVCGNIKNDCGTISANVGRHKTNRKKMAVVDFGGRTATTHYTVVARYGKYTHVRLKLETGRTHQIRVHMAFIGHAVFGDEVYGNPRGSKFGFLKGQCLHAKKIGFIHPSTHEYMEFTSSLPPYFVKVLSALESCAV